MEAESPPIQSTIIQEDTHTKIATDKESLNRRLSSNSDETEADNTIHAFNISNVTVIEKQLNTTGDSEGSGTTNKLVSCEGPGSDSGVEVIENNDNLLYQRALSSNSGNSHDFDTLNCARSCDSSIISCCSNYEEAYNLLVRRNSTLLEDYTLRNGDRTSENGSESSSITGSSSSRNSKRSNLIAAKKKIILSESKNKERSRLKSTSTVKNSTSIRPKSIDRIQGRPPSKIGSNSNNKKLTPNSLTLTTINTKKDLKRTSSVRHSSATRTPVVTPTDDGRWPSINSKPAPLMSKSLRAIMDTPKNSKINQMESKTIEKYATLPRRRKEKSVDDIKQDKKKSSSREDIINRLSKRTTMQPKLLLKNKKQKVRIYHEMCIQTVLTMTDVDNALSGTAFTPLNPDDMEKCDKDVQVDMRQKDVEQLQSQLRDLMLKYDQLKLEHHQQTEKLAETETKLRSEIVEKNGLKLELQDTSKRVLAILGGENNFNGEEENISNDSLMMLERRFHNVSQVVIDQEAEISKLNSCCRTLQINLEKSLATQQILLQQHQDLEAESVELQEFMQAEKTTLADALKDAENQVAKVNSKLVDKVEEVEEKLKELKKYQKLNEQRWQENLGLQARLGVLEAKSRQLLVHQGSSVSGTAVALSALIGRLEGLVDELVTSYNISEQELEDVIFHNEAYNTNSSSSPEATPEKSITDKTPSPKKGSSFVSAFINAIKNAAAQSPFINKEISRDNSSSNEMLDSETEPCLMMEHVLEDVVIPDGHSHNMISSCHSLLNSCLTQSESSLKDLSQMIFHSNGGSLNSSFTSEMFSINEIFPSISLVDQVIDVDNLVTKLLKVIRIIQLENDDCMNEMQEQRDSFADQVDKQKETNKIVVKQLRDWEILGSRLKSEVKELMNQLSRKNNELDNVKTELNNQREQVEKLNQDVCELSTALSKNELELKIKEEQVQKAVKNWEKTGEIPEVNILRGIILTQNEMASIKDELLEKERRLSEVAQEFLTSRQFLTESLKEAVNEAKKQYDAIDNALEVLHNNQSVVQQCKPLADLQRDLENISFQTASVMPLVAPAADCNANAALLQAIANLKIAAPINTTA